ncbi:MAG: DegV family protein [Ruminococcus sp.]|jgi:DegV family protein with EDD domain|nr:DegV family protein [Ruminococcus sp.]
MKIKLTSDSTCDLSPELLKKYDIDILPLYVSLGEETKKDGVEATPDDIYKYVDKTGKLPKTSTANISDIIEFFENYRNEGYTVIHFSISSDFSSSYHNACIAAEEVDGVFVVDSRNLSTGQGLVVLHAADLVLEGKTAEEIKAECDALTPKVEASFVIDSIDYLHKGGRCSAVAALGANLLKLKPCIEVIDGKMTPSKKYRGKIDKVIIDYVCDRLRGRDDIVKNRIFITHTKCNQETVDAVRNKINELYPGFNEILETTAGCTITSHCGPNTLGILFIRK